MFMVDLAVPRDIEPEVKALEDVFLYTVDDLGSIVSEGQALRQAAVVQAKTIIDERVQNFTEWIQARASMPAIHVVHRHAQTLREQEVARAHKRLAQGEAPEQVMEALAQSLTQKWMHGPLRALADATAEERDILIRLVPELFKITR
jgi:glutamyl-tRNA reductase